jgi:hypothetical protein
MREIKDLGLTIRQHEEVLGADPLLVAAWLDRIDDPSIDNPVGWFLTGVRSGIFPHQLADQSRSKAIHLAERFISNAGMLIPDEANLLHELFEAPSAMLRFYADEEPLREKMLLLWKLERPRGEKIEAEYAERAARWRAAREKVEARDPA